MTDFVKFGMKLWGNTYVKFIIIAVINPIGLCVSMWNKPCTMMARTFWRCWYRCIITKKVDSLRNEGILVNIFPSIEEGKFDERITSVSILSRLVCTMSFSCQRVGFMESLWKFWVSNYTWLRSSETLEDDGEINTEYGSGNVCTIKCLMTWEYWSLTANNECQTTKPYALLFVGVGLNYTSRSYRFF